MRSKLKPSAYFCLPLETYYILLSSIVKSLKLQLGEDPDYDKVIARYKSQKLDWTKSMTVMPVNFSRAQTNVKTCKDDV